ncbi:hypothetical protein AALO_G00141780 [Alosa alosa]|uniref:Uncharacterized protein n=1 Tax=Alosa alosa TaxID=278164 RepID=A0AAV6GIK4_9TELE|nr:hypothetical protein AALO_G00141780 [Alosa alosa]
MTWIPVTVHENRRHSRFLVRINPDSNKCTAKEQMSKTTERVVKQKTSYMNPHVISFIRDLTEFYLLTD